MDFSFHPQESKETADERNDSAPLEKKFLPEECSVSESLSQVAPQSSSNGIDNDSFAWAQPSMDVVQFDECALFSSQITHEQQSVTASLSTPVLESPELEPAVHVNDHLVQEPLPLYPNVPEIVEDTVSDYLEEPLSEAINEPVCTAEPDPEPDFGFEVIEKPAEFEAPSPVSIQLDQPAKVSLKKPLRKKIESEPTIEHVRHSTRARKTVERLGAEIQTGSGMKLVDIPEIAAILAEKSPDDKSIVTLHRLLLGQPGDSRTRKAHLQSFNGLVSAQFTSQKRALEGKLAKLALTDLRALAETLSLDLTAFKNKEPIAKRITEFLSKPNPAIVKATTEDEKKAPAIAAKKRPAPKKKTTTKKTKKGEISPTPDSEIGANTESHDD